MRLPPAEMMYSATWRTSTTSECNRARTTASTAIMSASMGAYNLAKSTVGVECCSKGAMLGGTSVGVNGTARNRAVVSCLTRYHYTQKNRIDSRSLIARET